MHSFRVAILFSFSPPLGQALRRQSVFLEDLLAYPKITRRGAVPNTFNCRCYQTRFNSSRSRFISTHCCSVPRFTAVGQVPLPRLNFVKHSATFSCPYCCLTPSVHVSNICSGAAQFCAACAAFLSSPFQRLISPAPQSWLSASAPRLS